MSNKLLTPRKRTILLNGRRESLKGKLPSNWRKQVIELNPEYDSFCGTNLMNNVHQGRSSDNRLLDIWQEIVDKHDKEKTAMKKRKANSMTRSKIVIP